MANSAVRRRPFAGRDHLESDGVGWRGAFSSGIEVGGDPPPDQ
jgi:hypothetical protein